MLSDEDTVKVEDIAVFILEQLGYISTMKLQKLVYYCQAYSLGWTGKPLFTEEIKAWTNGPVVNELFVKHKGLFMVTYEDIEGNSDNLSETQEDICDAVIEALKGLTGWELAIKTKTEDPWRNFFYENAERHNLTIPHRVLKNYYAD